MSNPESAHRTRLGLRIPMRDGVTLSALLVRPLGEGPFPTIFRLTPYIADTFLTDGVAFAMRGYAYVCADVRGRGESGGGPYRQMRPDGLDGHDAIAWIADQPWSDGNVVLHGSSYSGTNQWTIAATRPPALRAICPAGVSLAGFDYPRPGGILPASIFQILTLTAGRALHGNALADTGQWNRWLTQIWRSDGRLTDLSDLSGNPAPLFHEIAQGATGAEPFVGAMLDPDDYAAIEVPVLSSTGVADLTCAGTLEAHRRFLAHGQADAITRSRLVIGPWEHLGLETGNPQVGLLRHGPAAALDMRALKLDWFDWILGRGPEPDALHAPALVYRAGEDRWVRGPSLEALTGEPQVFGLGDERLLPPGAPEPLAATRRAFLCDPGDFAAVEPELRLRDAPAPTKDNAPTIRVGPSYNDLTGCAIGSDPTNQVFQTDLGGRGLEWMSDPLPVPLSLCGHPRVQMWLELDGVDTDLAFFLDAVLPQGDALTLSADLLRLRDRAGIGKEALASPGASLLLARDLRFVSRTLPAETRLRFVVRHCTSIRLEKNLQSATPVRWQMPAEAVAVRVAVLSGPDHRSSLTLPIAQGDGQ
ncbi:MAG: CocE/NonD family hydrolase [Erythrobacter sp.]|uniref:CocE/NonD family hydrolase n=1 Tax=Erythrobacter sp. TaxID=1042 RepID=UPI0025FFB085|nr:CocE/NonD family hydrolase [Erythrobacter sp.]MCL9999045.1 CocE/NonD family hydrolase [Erythrobacter sp.]